MRPLLLLAPLICACVDYTLDKGDEPEPADPVVREPDIEVYPLVVDFGDLPLGTAPTEPVVISVFNEGTDNLGIDGVSLEDPSGPFVVTDVESVLLTPGQETTFTVAYYPDTVGWVTGRILVDSNDPDEPTVPVDLEASAEAPDIAIDPVYHDFGILDLGTPVSLDVTLTSEGVADLHVSDVAYATGTGELGMDLREDLNGPLPWTLPPGATATVTVSYTPADDQADEGHVTVRSDDPDEDEITATQVGDGLAFEGFTTGWYVWDDGVAYETTSNPAHVVESHGDYDLYWYEPSGVHGLLDSTDPTADFEIMRQYVLDHAPTPVEVSGPFTYDGDSTLATYAFATFTYFMCDFYLEPDADPTAYEISAGSVDDGIEVIVNGHILGTMLLGESARYWPLTHAEPGRVNTLIVILVDDSAVDKYVYELAFYKDGIMVTD